MGQGLENRAGTRAGQEGGEKQWLGEEAAQGPAHSRGTGGGALLGQDNTAGALALGTFVEATGKGIREGALTSHPAEAGCLRFATSHVGGSSGLIPALGPSFLRLLRALDSQPEAPGSSHCPLQLESCSAERPHKA